MNVVSPKYRVTLSTEFLAYGAANYRWSSSNHDSHLVGIPVKS